MTSLQPRGNRIGRPSKLTPETHEHIVRLVSAGNYLSISARHAGISEATLHNWMKRGREALAAREAHPDPDGSYCPACAADRTEELAAIRAEEEQLNADLADDDVAVGITPGPCPTCGSAEHPAAWELPESERPYLEFLEAVTKGETEAEAAAVVAWRRAFTEDWRAARDYLVRRAPDRWAATTRISISAEETEQRVDRATEDVLASLGLDGDALALPSDMEEWNGDVADVPEA